MTSEVFVDVITNVVFANGVYRIHVARHAGDDKIEHVGTIMLPGNQAGTLIKQMADNVSEIANRLREKQTAQLAEQAIAELGEKPTTRAPGAGTGENDHHT